MTKYGLSLSASILLFFTASWPLIAGDESSSTEPFKLARVKFSIRGNYRWDYHPEADGFLLETIKKNTAINADCSWNDVSLDNLNEMIKYPVLFITTTEEFNPPENELANLKEYILRGGFVCADDCVYKGNGPRDKFFTSFKSAIDRIFGVKMEKIPLSHDIYHCLYDLNNGVPFMQGKDDGGWGLHVKGRLAVFLSPGDIHCGWQSRYLRGSARTRPWFSVEKEEQALQMGTNIFVYALSH